MRAPLATTIAFAIAALGAARGARADEPLFVVIVHPSQAATALDKKWVADAFLKKRRRWSAETAIVPVDQRKTAPLRAQFTRRMLDRSLASVRTYWNQIIFSGRGVPPAELESEAAVVAFVANTPGAIGYVSAAADLKGVRVIEVR